MSFSVVPTDLDAFAVALDDLADGTTTADKYRADNMNSSEEVSGLLFSLFRSFADSVNEKIDANMKAIRDTLRDGAEGVRVAEVYYQKTDEAVASATDSIYNSLPG